MARNALLNTIKTVLGIIFPLITFPYVSRVLGVDNLGIYNFSASIISYFALFASLGIATYGIREGARIRDNKEDFNSFLSELFTINFCSTILSYLLLGLLLITMPFFNNYRLVILILSAEMIFTTLGVSWVCNVYEDFFAIAVRTIAFQIISLVLIFFFVRSSEDLIKYVVVLLVSNSGSNVVNYFYVRNKYAKFHLTTHVDWKKHLKPILIIFSTAIAITVYVSSDATMLGFMTDDYQVGLYGTSVKIYTIIKNILAAILVVLIPKFSSLFSTKDIEKANWLFSKVFDTLNMLMLPICVGLFALSDDIILIISGKEFIGATTSLRLLSIAICFSLYAYLYTQCILIPKKEEKIVFQATMTSAIANVVLNLFAIPLWGINGAAFTTIVAEFITFIVAFHYSRSIIQFKPVFRNVISTIIGCVVIASICWLCNSIDLFIARVIISIVGSVLAYCFVLLIIGNTALIDINKRLLKKMKRET